MRNHTRQAGMEGEDWYRNLTAMVEKMYKDIEVDIKLRVSRMCMRV